MSLRISRRRGDAPLRQCHARLEVEDVLEGGARRVVDVAAREEELYLVGRDVPYISRYLASGERNA